MNDLEMIKKCARKMDLTILDVKNGNQLFIFGKFGSELYDPLRNDTQALAMVKKFQLAMHTFEGKEGREWCVNFPFTEDSNFHGFHTFSQDLNRAICEAVAKLP